MAVDVLTLFVDQGALAGIRVGLEGIIVDAHMPECENVRPEEIQQSLSTYFDGIDVRGLILTGFDSDHAHDLGVEWILSEFQPAWIMYPKYYKDTDCATAVFNSINKHERQRALTSRPLIRHSVRLDKMASRFIPDLGRGFSVELFSPHFEDMDISNNCSIVAKIVGNDPKGFRYLATGDTEIDRWETISRLFGDNIAADVMAASHHGSVSGVYPKALLNVSPNTVLISAGVESQYDHPHGQSIKAYQAVAEHVWATNAGGIGKNLLTRRRGSDFDTIAFEHPEAAAA
jgi:beta-lactamase superfamily II metal-dependent hydrolase